MKHTQLHQVILHLTEAIEHRLAVLRHGLVVSRFAAFQLGAARAAIEQGQRQLRAERPETVGQIDPVGKAATTVAAAGGNGQIWIPGGFGDANLGVSGDHPAFRGSDIGTAFQQLRRQSHGDCWQRWQLLAYGNAQLARRHADQYGNRMLQLRTLPFQVDGLSLSAFQLGQRLADIGFRHDAGVVLVFREFQRAFIGRHSGIE